MKIILSLIFSALICLGMFFVMHLMISSDQQTLKEKTTTPHLVYLRDKQDTHIERKKRVKAKVPPKEIVLKKIKLLRTPLDVKTNKMVKIKPFKIEQQKIDLSAINSLGGAQIEMNMGLIDANSLQILRRSNPRYPRRAKLKKLDGFVKLIFTISKEGNVSNVRVLDSKPKGIFEKSAIKAMKRWKFKHTGIQKDATITYNYRLAN